MLVSGEQVYYSGLMSEQATTFRESYADGSQLHESTPAEAVTTLDTRVMDAIGALGMEYEKGMDPTARLGIGLWIPGVARLGNLPRPTWEERRQPNVALLPLLDAFGQFLQARQAEIFQGIKPAYVRVLAIGHQAAQLGDWHCDVVIEKDTPRTFISRAVAAAGRLVVGAETKLRGDVPANVRAFTGNFMVHDVVPEKEGIAWWEDLGRGYPEGSTIVTRETGSIITITQAGFEPAPASVDHLDNLVLHKLTSTTLHAPQPVSDALRVSLQCAYEPNRQKI